MTDVNDTAVEEVVPEEDTMICDTPNPDPSDPGFIQVEAKKDGKAARIYYNFGVDLDDMVAKFNGEVVYSQARSQMKIKLQSAMRSYLATDRDPSVLTTGYIPGVALERAPVNMEKASEDYFLTLDESAQDAMIANLMKSRQG